MPETLPRYVGPTGAAKAHAAGLETAHGWRRRGRQVQPGAKPRAAYAPGPHDDRVYPMFGAEDLVAVEPRSVAAGE